MVLLNQGMKRSPLAADVVRFVGEPIAAVVTEERYQGEDAAELVFVDYDPLPAVVDMDDAVTNEVLLHPEAGTNVVFELADPPDESFFDGCEVVVTQRLRNQRVAIAPLEVRSTAAVWDGERFTVWAGTQGAQGVPGRAPAGRWGSIPVRCTSSRRTWAAPSVPSPASRPRTWSRPGSRGTSPGRCGGPRRAPRTCSPWATAAARSSA
jgi:hypothetical protein